ncbi:MAG: outer membrane beta-barrel protein [Cytophagales bacterium]
MRTSFIAFILLFTSNLVFAQNSRFGIEVGQNMSVRNMGDKKFQSLIRDSYQVGIFASQTIIDRFGIQTGIIYMRQDYSKGLEVQEEYASYKYTYYINSIDNLIIPFDLIYQAPRGITIGVGAFSSYNLSYMPHWYPDCTVGESEFHLPTQDNPISYGIRYSLSAQLLERKSLALGLVLRYYEEYHYFETGKISTYANSTSLSLFINYKGYTSNSTL